MPKACTQFALEVSVPLPPAAIMAQGLEKPPVVLPSSSPAVASSNLNRSSPAWPKAATTSD